MNPAGRLEANPPGQRSAAITAAWPVAIVVVVILRMALSDGVSPRATFRALAVAIVLGCLLLGLFGALLRDRHRGAIATGLAFGLGVAFTAPVLLVLWIVAVVAAVALDRLPGRRIPWASWSASISTVTVVLLAITIVAGFMDGTVPRAVAELRQGGGLPPADDSALVDPGKPDVYVVILDGYARPDTLQSAFGLNDQPFLAQLSARGFDISSDSHSNYPVTAETLASMLNMDYLDQIPALDGIASGDPATDGTFNAAINDNAVFDEFRDDGYQIVTTGSGWEQLALRGSDVYLDGGQLNTFEDRLLTSSGFGRLVQWMAPPWVGDQLRSRVNDSIDEVRTVAETPTPKPRLVLAHVLSPHPPFLFGPDGELRPLDVSGAFDFDWAGAEASATDKAWYVDQIEYLNGRVVPMVDAILRAARRPTVVILMSDHGSRLTTPPGATAMAPEANRNFLATETPGHTGLFGQSPTPVNIFSTLLDTYLGKNLPTLPNRVFTAPWGHPLQLAPLPPGEL